MAPAAAAAGSAPCNHTSCHSNGGPLSSVPPSSFANNDGGVGFKSPVSTSSLVRKRSLRPWKTRTAAAPTSGSGMLPTAAAPSLTVCVVDGGGGESSRSSSSSGNGSRSLDATTPAVAPALLLPSSYVPLPRSCLVTAATRSSSLLLSNQRDPHTRKYSVSFSTLDIYEHVRILGDNPSVSSGPPLSIGWMAVRSVRGMDVSQYEDWRGERRSRAALTVPRQLREEWLLDEGFSRAERAAAIREVMRVKASRSQAASSRRCQKTGATTPLAVQRLLRTFQTTNTDNDSSAAATNKKAPFGVMMLLNNTSAFDRQVEVLLQQGMAYERWQQRLREAYCLAQEEQNNKAEQEEEPLAVAVAAIVYDTEQPEESSSSSNCQSSGQSTQEKKGFATAAMANPLLSATADDCCLTPNTPWKEKSAATTPSCSPIAFQQPLHPEDDDLLLPATIGSRTDDPSHTEIHSNNQNQSLHNV